jgi:hypothetical protein
MNKIDIIVLTEIYIYDNEVNKYNIPNFDIIAKPRNSNRGGGVLCYVNKNIKYKEIEINFVNAEILCLKINNDIKIVAIYRPPECNKNLFIKELKDKILKCSNCNNTLIIGDINLDILNEEDNIINNYENKLAKYCFNSYVNIPTREEIANKKLSSTCIDHIYFKNERNCKIIKSFVIKTKITDHYMIGCIITNSKVDVINEEKIEKKINYNKLAKLILSTNWDEINNIEDSEIMYDKICKKFDSLKNQCMYEKNKNLKKIRIDKPWCTHKIKLCIKIRDILFKKWKNSPYNETHKLNYQKYRNKVTNIIKTEKIKYYSNKFNDCISKIKETWQIINSMLGRQSINIDSIILKYMSDIYELKEIVDNFAEYFVESIDNLSIDCDIKLCEQTPVENHLQSMILPEITDEITLNIINLLNAKKGPGDDGICMEDIKNGGPDFISCITKFINSCVKNEKYPEALKLAIVRPIYKGGDHKLFSNYRPIAILDLLDKISQKYIEVYFTDHLDTNKIIDTNQFAYQKSKGTNLLISEVSNYINEELGKNNHLLCLFVDFSKAFDLVDPNLLIEDLEEIGVRGPALKIMENMLKNRKIKVKVANISSEVKHLKKGVVQGGILSAKWFLVYINKIFKILKKCKIFMFADDLLIIASEKDFKLAEKHLQHDFDLLLEWAHDKKLIINAKKTKVMHIYNQYTHIKQSIKLKVHNNKCLHNFQINCNCNILEQVDEYDYLGVTIDSHFKWDKHVNKLIKKLRSALSQISTMKRYVEEKTLKTLYYSLVHPYILYGITAWGFVNSSALTQLIIMQKRILKKMKKGEKFNYDDNVYAYWKILPVKMCAKFIFLIEKYFNESHGEVRTNHYETRSSQNEPLETPRSKNRFHERTTHYILPRLWNEIPKELKNLTTKIAVKSKLKMFYVSQL